MSTSSPSTRRDDGTFACACTEWMRSACHGEGFYKEHEGKRYCVLHYPGREKEDDFEQALQRKLDDNDFDFQEIWFPYYLHFPNFTFSNNANFSFAYFNDIADFEGVEFKGRASFFCAHFDSDVDFSDVVFHAPVNFQRTKFIKKDSYVGFDATTFKDGISFGENEFSDQVLMSFDAAIFEKPERATFHTVRLRAHWFINVDSRKFTFINVDWDSLNKRDVILREIKALKSSGYEKLSPLLEITFRQLAVNAEENNRYEEAANFRYMAMDLRRLLRLHDVKGLKRGRKLDLFRLSWWYWLLSGYGERVTKAFCALITIWLLFGFIYWLGNTTWWQPKQSTRPVTESSEREKLPAVTERQQTFGAMPLTLTEALIYSAGVMSLQKPEPYAANKRAKAFVLTETILGPLQAALLALAIRRKFMR